jgi:hypothetical protein
MGCEIDIEFIKVDVLCGFMLIGNIPGNDLFVKLHYLLLFFCCGALPIYSCALVVET